MKLRQLFENIYQEASGVTNVAIIFGRFNPPHQGHAAAWRTASSFDEWFVGTNEGTVGPKDPLPFKVKVAAMKTIYPEIEGHLVAEQSWWTLATKVYKKYGPVTLHVVTDEKDAKIFVPGLQDQNGKEGPHGYYRFKDIKWAKADRISSATDLRAAVANDDPKAFEQAAGVPANIVVAGRPFFELVKHYLTPYLHQAAEKEQQKAERARLKAEKEAAKADRLASKQPTSQEEPETLAEKIQKLELELLESCEVHTHIVLNTTLTKEVFESYIYTTFQNPNIKTIDIKRFEIKEGQLYGSQSKWIEIIGDSLIKEMSKKY